MVSHSVKRKTAQQLAAERVLMSWLMDNPGEYVVSPLAFIQRLFSAAAGIPKLQTMRITRFFCCFIPRGITLRIIRSIVGRHCVTSVCLDVTTCALRFSNSQDVGFA